jgi:hypothetical protein
VYSLKEVIFDSRSDSYVFHKNGKYHSNFQHCEATLIMEYLTSVSLIVSCPRFFQIYMGIFGFMYAKKDP